MSTYDDECNRCGGKWEDSICEVCDVTPIMTREEAETYFRDKGYIR